MRILITGADGFVGRHVSAALLAAGHSLRLGVRIDRGQINIFGDFDVVELGDIGPDTKWKKALEGVDCVINLAGRAHILDKNGIDQKNAFDEINWRGAESLFRAAKELGIQQFLHLSSAHVLGVQTQNGEAFDDETPPAPASEYANSKLAGENALVQLGQDYSGGLVILRPPLIVGSGVKGNLERLQRWLKKPAPIPLAGLKNRRTLIGIENLVSAIIAVLAVWQIRPQSGVYLVGDASPVSTTKILKSIREGVRGRAWLVPIPAFILKYMLQFAGGKKLVVQLMGNLEIDSHGFEQTFNWRPELLTVESLIRMGQGKRG